MHPLKNYYFITGCLLYLFVQLCRTLSIKFPILINSYLTDLLFIPLLLFFTIWLLRIIKRDKKIKLSVFKLIFTWLFISIVFEYYLPQKNSIYTADIVDVFMYFFGTVSFYFLQKKRL